MDYVQIRLWKIRIGRTIIMSDILLILNFV